MDNRGTAHSKPTRKKTRTGGILTDSEFTALTTLLTHMDERLHGEIKAVREEVKTTYEEVKKVNGGLRKAKEDIIVINDELEHRGKTCFRRIEGMEPSQKLVKHLNFISKHYKKFILVLIVVLIIIQAVGDTAVDNQWISDVIKWFK
jgi:peptidoglycan hydrolase CwlO-like protein